MNYDQAIKDLQDTLLVITEIERRQSALLKEHSQMIHDHDRHLAEIHEFRRRTDQNLAEISDKLNGLIGFVGGIHMPPPAPPA